MGPQVIFTPSGRRQVVPMGSTVLDAARAAGVDLDSVCGGRGICGRCQVEVGSAPGVASGGLAQPGPTELDYRGRRPLVAGRRLGCAARVLGDLVIDVPPDSQVHRQVVRKRPEVRDIPVDPVVRLHYVDVAPAALGEPRGEQQRVQQALADEWDLHDLTFDLDVTRLLPGALQEGGATLTVAVHDQVEVTAVWPGFHDRAVGIAFDVGSTTIAGHMCDLSTGEILASAGVMNPQIRFGEDLMSRVSYAMLTEGGAARLTSAVREALDGIVGELTTEAAVARSDVLELTLVGNPIMHHLVLGLDPIPLGVAPFTLATDTAVRTTAAAIGVRAHPGARLYVLPCIAGHVGADAAAAILSEGPQHGDSVQLLVDVGTNAEIVLGSRQRLLAASSPTGPAFEGAQISSGQRAAPGAIERVRIDRDTLEPRFRVVGCDLWSDEDGFAEEVPLVTGICGSGIIEAIAELFLAGVITSDGTIGAGDHARLVPDGRTVSYLLHDRLHVTQNDVRAIQLAKAALYAGCRLLMDELGVDEVDEIRLAGAFGSHIDPVYAMTLGLIPDCEPDRVSAAGNAAGTGAIMALLSDAARREVESVTREVHKVETAVEPRFQEHFVAAMGIPHSTERFTRLASVVDLPIATTARRRRRRPAEEGR